VVGAIEIYLPLVDLVNSEEEHTRLQKDLVEVEGQIQRLEALLASPFTEKAPASSRAERARQADQLPGDGSKNQITAGILGALLDEQRDYSYHLEGSREDFLDAIEGLSDEILLQPVSWASGL